VIFVFPIVLPRCIYSSHNARTGRPWTTLLARFQNDTSRHEINKISAAMKFKFKCELIHALTNHHPQGCDHFLSDPSYMYDPFFPDRSINSSRAFYPKPTADDLFLADRWQPWTTPFTSGRSRVNRSLQVLAVSWAVVCRHLVTS